MKKNHVILVPVNTARSIRLLQPDTIVVLWEFWTCRRNKPRQVSLPTLNANISCNAVQPSPLNIYSGKETHGILQMSPTASEIIFNIASGHNSWSLYLANTNYLDKRMFVSEEGDWREDLRLRAISRLGDSIYTLHVQRAAGVGIERRG